jgi:hypothetical protein
MIGLMSSMDGIYSFTPMDRGTYLPCKMCSGMFVVFRVIAKS